MSEILANARREGEVFSFGENSGEQEKAPAASPAEEVHGGDVEPSQEGGKDAPGEGGNGVSANAPVKDKDVPFNKHPRFKEIVDENRHLKEAVESMAKQQREFFERVTPRPKPEAPQAPEWFTKAYGEDPSLWDAYSRATAEQQKSIAEQVKREIYEEQQRYRSQMEAERKEMDEWVERSIDGVRDAHGVDLRSDQDLMNRVIKFAVEFKPTDDEGAISLAKAYEIYTKLNPAQGQDKAVAEKKAVADRTMSGKQSPSSGKDYFTRHDLRKDFRGLIG